MLRQQYRDRTIRGILVGDPAYTCTSFLLTPIRNVHTEAERRYNVAQRRTRSVIERAFGIWKRRFPCVAFGNRLRCSLQHNMAIVVATVCLHNLARERNDPLPGDDGSADEDGQPQHVANEEVDVRGDVFRQRYIRQNFIV
ncbi:putative nuclease HARBI1 isoform X1 [Gigantopelta aegis]|uniref:putative nuclease HARBI1 isoform X1 n=1 Tax=Gigantopelta aegis TaxID=1735272 RepID=UPI001B88CCD5|nr:putative nuclease HARBI1 isoform X1 [Gigantopelta aegis]